MNARIGIIIAAAVAGCSSSSTPPPVVPPAPPTVTYAACVVWLYDPTLPAVTACEGVNDPTFVPWPDLATCQADAAAYLTPDANPNGSIQTATCYPTTALPTNAESKLRYH